MKNLMITILIIISLLFSVSALCQDNKTASQDTSQSTIDTKLEKVKADLDQVNITIEKLQQQLLQANKQLLLLQGYYAALQEINADNASQNLPK